MLVPSSSATTTLATSTTPATSSSPTRPSRLRGLSYLRNYTHLHSTSRNPATPLVRSHTSPEPSRNTSPSDGPNQGGLVHPNVTAGLAAAVSAQDADEQDNIAVVDTAPTAAMSTESQDVDARQRVTRSRAETYTAGSGRSAEGDARPNASRSMSAGAQDILAAASADKKQMPTIRLIPHHEARASRPSLTFPIVNRTLPTNDSIIKVGRYSERDNNNATNDPNVLKSVGFKSKVVSRRHCEFWCQENQWFIRDVKSSSGTFLNHVRLSPAGPESKPYPVNDGDIVQLGIDFKGGEEVIYRCVKIRVECNRNWQKSLNQFNTSTHKTIRNLASGGRKDSDTNSVNSSECSICLNPVAPCQALFVAPCSHVWHYKCVRNIIYPHWPSFQCPNCRAYADLEADVEPSDSEFEDDTPEEARVRAESSDELQDDQHPQQQQPLSSNSAQSGLVQSATTSTLIPSSTMDPTSDEHEADEDCDHEAAQTPVPDRSLPIAMPMRNQAPATPSNHNSATRVGSGPSAAMLAGPEGPATPRNDAGPFVLDTIASRGGLGPDGRAGNGQGEGDDWA